MTTSSPSLRTLPSTTSATPSCCAMSGSATALPLNREADVCEITLSSLALPRRPLISSDSQSPYSESLSRCERFSKGRMAMDLSLGRGSLTGDARKMTVTISAPAAKPPKSSRVVNESLEIPTIQRRNTVADPRPVVWFSALMAKASMVSAILSRWNRPRETRRSAIGPRTVCRTAADISATPGSDFAIRRAATLTPWPSRSPLG